MLKTKRKLYELVDTMPPQDRYGQELNEGDLISYPVRKQADMSLTTGRIRRWLWKVDLESQEKFCDIKIWLISRLPDGYLVPRKSIIHTPERIIKLNIKNYQLNEELNMLMGLPLED